MEDLTRQEKPTWPGVPELVESVRNYVAEFPREIEAGPEYYERKEFWADFITSLRGQAESSKITWSQFDYLVGGLVAAKEWLGDNDLLTGLGNRRSYEQHLKDRMAESRRNSSTFTLVCADIDNLKSLNDERGHLAGDEFLVQLGRVIRENKRQEDFAARVGGDEIMIILPNTKSQGAQSFIKKLKEEIKNRVEGNQEFLSLKRPLGASFGWGEWNREESGEKLEERVDQAMYEEKNRNKNG